MPRMDLNKLQPSIDALNAEIDRLTSARDTLLALSGSATPNRTPKKAAQKRKAPTLSAAGRKRLSEAMRKRWAEQKRKQRAEAKAKT